MLGAEVASLVLTGVSTAAGLKTVSSRSYSSYSEVCGLRGVTEIWLINMLISLFVFVDKASWIQ